MKSVIRDGKVYSLESDHGKTSFLMRAGADMVRNVMSEGGALDMIAHGNVTESDTFPGHPIAVNDTYFFPGTVTEENAPAEPEPTPVPKKKRR